MQCTSIIGDKTKSANHFLNILLPRLSLVVIQDYK